MIINKSVHLTHRLVTDYGGTDEVRRVISKGVIGFSETETEHRVRTLTRAASLREEAVPVCLSTCRKEKPGKYGNRHVANHRVNGMANDMVNPRAIYSWRTT